MRVIKRLSTAAKPNGSTYAAPFHKIYVANTLSKAVTVVDVNKGEIIKTLPFNSETGMPQSDSVAKKVYVNLNNTNEIAEIDPANDAVLGTYPGEGCCYNHGMAIDSEHQSRISSVQWNQDADGLCPGYPQGNCASPAAHRRRHCEVRSWSGAHLRGVFQRIHFQQNDADHYRKLEDFRVQEMVHSLAVDTATHRVYAPEQREDGQPIARMIVYEAIDSTPKR